MTKPEIRKRLLGMVAVLACLLAGAAPAQTTLGEARSAIEDLRRQVADRDRVIAGLQSRLLASDDSLKGVSAMIGGLEKQLAESRADLDETRDRLDRALAAVREREAATDDLHRRLTAAGGDKARAVEVLKTQRLILSVLLAAALAGIVFAWRRQPARN